MCIIAIKSRGIDLPSEEVLQNMWKANKDGAGFMYPKNGAVHIKKGFMKYEDFREELNKLEAECGLKDLPLIMHFRITTHGGTKPENTHPFPVTDSVGMLKKLNSTAKIGMAHNGIINIYPREGISDTMEYDISQLAPLSRAMPTFYKDANIMKMISNAIGSSKMAFMDGQGKIYTIGSFVEEGGMRYSNRSFETPKYTRHFPYAYSSDDWESWKEYYEEKGKKEKTPFSKRVMWLDEKAGEFVIDGKGNFMEDGEYAIDYSGKVYEYDYEADMLVKKDGYRAYTENGYALRYDWKSPYTLVEIVDS